MLIVVVTIFALLWLPHRGMLVYNTVAAMLETQETDLRYMDLWFLMFAKTCIYINRYSKKIFQMQRFFLSTTNLLIMIYICQRYQSDPLQRPVDEVPARVPADAALPGGGGGLLPRAERHLPRHQQAQHCLTGDLRYSYFISSCYKVTSYMFKY